ncbi:MAG: DUF1214 domain-containing protein [Hellea sp.]
MSVTIIGLSGLAAKHMTTAALTDENAIYNSFEKTESLWLYSDKIGGAAATNVERAKVAIAGPLGLSSKEAVYFIAVEDNQGRPLLSSCDYRVTGSSIDARWWSLTLYDSETQHYVPNAINRSSWNSAAIPKGTNGDWVINVSQTSKQETWLPSQERGARPFELNLRVYNPSAETRAKIPNITLPNVVRASC